MCQRLKRCLEKTSEAWFPTVCGGLGDGTEELFSTPRHANWWGLLHGFIAIDPSVMMMQVFASGIVELSSRASALWLQAPAYSSRARGLARELEKAISALQRGEADSA